MVAQHLGDTVTPLVLERALIAFGQLADDIERRLTSIEEVDVAASPPAGDPLERDPLVPPA